VLVGGKGIDMPATLRTAEKKLHSWDKNTALRRSEVVDVLATVEDEERSAMDASGDQEGDPEANVTLTD